MAASYGRSGFGNWDNGGVQLKYEEDDLAVAVETEEDSKSALTSG